MYARGVWFPLDTPMRNKFWLLARGQACNRCVNRFDTSSFVHGRPNSCHCVRQLHADIVSQQRRATVGEPGAKEAQGSKPRRDEGPSTPTEAGYTFPAKQESGPGRGSGRGAQPGASRE